MKYLEDLNPAQREAVIHKDGPLLIVAGAGAGKTKTITYRILHLINQGVHPAHILGVTFTNKAAKEMRERVIHLLRTHVPGTPYIDHVPTLTTFHSFGVMLLRRFYELAKLPKQFTIFDRTDTRRLLKDIYESFGYDPKVLDPDKVLNLFSKAKNNNQHIRNEAGENKDSNLLIGLFDEYHRRLRAEGGVDFDDLLSIPYDLIKNTEVVKNYVQQTYKYIHIDEYQDTNKIQYLLATTLAAAHGNLCVVGDADQNIYSWRGADINNILRFEKDFPGAKKVVLEENYRSTQTIVTFANQAIAKNEHRLDKRTFTRNQEGQPVHVVSCADERAEATWIFDEIEKIHRAGTAYEDIAILYRANFQSRILEDIAMRRKVPYQLLGTKFFERKEIKDVLAYLKAAINPQAFGEYKRALQMPPRGVGKVTLAKLGQDPNAEIAGKAGESIKTFNKFLEDLRKDMETRTVSETLLHIIEQSGIAAHYQDRDADDIERLENMQELVSVSADFKGTGTTIHEQFLEHSTLVSDQDDLKETTNGVRMMTIHAAKGLEFQYVFVPGLEQDLFPHTRYEANQRPEDAEEERRLFYVAITRARHKLYLTHSQYRTLYGDLLYQQPSEFITDLDENLVERVDNNEEVKGVKAIFIDF